MQELKALEPFQLPFFAMNLSVALSVSVAGFGLQVATGLLGELPFGSVSLVGAKRWVGGVWRVGAGPRFPWCAAAARRRLLQCTETSDSCATLLSRLSRLALPAPAAWRRLAGRGRRGPTACWSRRSCCTSLCLTSWTGWWSSCGTPPAATTDAVLAAAAHGSQPAGIALRLGVACTATAENCNPWTLVCWLSMNRPPALGH